MLEDSPEPPPFRDGSLPPVPSASPVVKPDRPFEDITAATFKRVAPQNAEAPTKPAQWYKTVVTSGPIIDPTMVPIINFVANLDRRYSTLTVSE
ncbi:hypothetical protein HDV05_006257 [Chytridiales sp. JEL 0842]|nr:hypothetical protein HDV05_006257 [Chytridiales sp. JEL 0842]